MTLRRWIGAFIMATVTTMGGIACDRTAHGSPKLPMPAQDLPAPAEGETSRTAVFAGGCFWCTEAVFEKLEGVSDVVSGYAGGTRETADYETVSTGKTAHAEAMRVTYDPAKITYGQLLRVFFATHDPTTKNRQGPDHGTQYRSAVFYENDAQKTVAEAYIQQLTEAKVFERPIVTTLEPLEAFYEAEGYHQNFVADNPNYPYVQQVAVPKIKKLIEQFPDYLKTEGNGPTTAPTTQPTTQPVSKSSK